jgi:hypothetical protein
MISWRHVTRWTRYVRDNEAQDYCRMGWCIADTFEGTPHGAYAVLAAWLCDCKLVEPVSRETGVAK